MATLVLGLATILVEPASASERTPEQLAAIVRQRSETAAPGFFDSTGPATHWAIESERGDVAYDGTYRSLRVAPGSVAQETVITMGSERYRLRECSTPSGAECDVKDGGQSSAVTTPAGGSTTVYMDGGAAGATDSVVQRMENRVRHLAVLYDRTAPTSYRFELVGAKFSIEADGAIAVKDAGSGDVIGAVAPPWALDDKGVAVPTTYRVDDHGRLVQHVDHRTGNYAYPIVADPTVSLGWYIYFRYEKDYIQSIWPYARWAYDATPWLCAWVPHPVAKAACRAVVFAYIGQIRDTFNHAYDNYLCAEVRTTYNGIIAGTRTYSC